MSKALFTPPAQRALHSHVYDALRQAIVTGVLTSGERVNEAEIAREMQISRAPIREAIRLLEQEGLLVAVPRRGTFVVRLSRSDVEEVYTLRADVESRAVRQALPHVTEEILAELDALFDQMKETANASDIAGLLEADIQFHRTIIETAGWPRLKKIWESLHPQTLTLYTLSALTDWTPPDHAARHAPVLDALRSGDPERAVSAIREHILGVGEQVMRRAPSNPDPRL
jgi:DNA-binding GntR family transcriptional regulator